MSWDYLNRMPKWPNDKEPGREDWIRLAAFIDGEGCIMVANKKVSERKGARSPRHDVQVIMGNCDPRLAEWCMSTFGGRVYARKKTQDRWRKAYVWHAISKLARAVLVGVYPFLLLKREQADVALAIAATFGSQLKGKCLPPEVVETRIRLANRLSELKKEVVEPESLHNIKVFPDGSTTTKRKEIGA